jgi:hypothetical protein
MFGVCCSCIAFLVSCIHIYKSGKFLFDASSDKNNNNNSLKFILIPYIFESPS